MEHIEIEVYRKWSIQKNGVFSKWSIQKKSTYKMECIKNGVYRK